MDFSAFYHSFVINDETYLNKRRHHDKKIKIYRITGRYPLMPYFSFQSYDVNGNLIDKLSDYEISPISGSGRNPYSDLSATIDNIGKYEIYLTPTGNFGFQNELKLKKEEQIGRAS